MQSTPRVVVFLCSEPRAASQKSKNGATCSKNGGKRRRREKKKTYLFFASVSAPAPLTRAFDML